MLRASLDYECEQPAGGGRDGVADTGLDTTIFSGKLLLGSLMLCHVTIENPRMQHSLAWW